MVFIVSINFCSLQQGNSSTVVVSVLPRFQVFWMFKILSNNLLGVAYFHPPFCTLPHLASFLLLSLKRKWAFVLQYIQQKYLIPNTGYQIQDTVRLLRLFIKWPLVLYGLIMPNFSNTGTTKTIRSAGYCLDQ